MKHMWKISVWFGTGIEAMQTHEHQKGQFIHCGNRRQLYMSMCWEVKTTWKSFWPG